MTPTDGPIVIGYDGSPTSARVLKEAASLFHGRRALVVVVWEPGGAFELMEPTIPVAPIDIRTALEVDQVMLERAQQAAEQGARTARDHGLDAEGLVVADEITVAQTLVRLARERGAAAIVVGTHRRGAIAEILLGSTARGVIRQALSPVVVVRDAA